MNKHCFRLIFRKVLGCLIPVAEITRAQRKAGQPQSVAPVVPSSPNPTWSLKRLAISVLLVGMPGWAAADILVDPNNPSGTNVISAANGVPVIEIATPNDKGLSHNRFSEFDVQKPGAIFNNSLVNGQSQLGGAVLLNPNLQREATAILTEVTGNAPSSISGTLEVFGRKADLLISNPDGVTLNGVTTLNASGLTVSTGRVQEGLQFLVDDKSGQVLIGAEGINTDGLSYFDIVARSVVLQGALGSPSQQTDILVAAGQGTYDPATGIFTAKPGAQGAGLAISGSAAGAMYGRYINLISSDSGAGVRHDGLIVAAQDIYVSAEGDIQLKDTGTKGNVQVAASGTFTNTGALNAATAQIQARDIVNQKDGYLGADGEVTLVAANSLSNSGVVRGKTVKVSAKDLANRDGGTFLASEDATFKLKGDLTNSSGAGIYAQNTLILDVAGAVLNDAATLAARNLGLSAASLTNQEKAQLLADNDLTLSLGRYQNSGLIRSQNNASLSLTHDADLLIDKAFKGPQAANLLSLSARHVTITDQLNSPGSVLIEASGDVRNQGAVIVGKSLSIDAKGLIDNRPGALIWAGENLFLQAGTQLLNGFNSQLLAMGDMSLSAGQKIQNNVGRIEAQKDLWIDTPLLENLSAVTGDLRIDEQFHLPAIAGLEILTGTRVDPVSDHGYVHTDNWYSDSYGLIEKQYFHTEFWTPRYSGDQLVVKQGVIKAGGDLLLNQGDAKETHASVRNLGGLMAAAGNVRVDGNLENIGTAKGISLTDFLKRSSAFARWTNTGPKADDPELHTTIYDLFDKNLLAPQYVPTQAELERVSASGDFAEFVRLANGLAPGQVIAGTDQWMYSLRKTATPELNAVFSAVFGADWKNLSHTSMRDRWIAFKAAPDKSLDFYADKQAELSAGQVFAHTGGTLSNGSGANWGEQRRIEVQIGSEKVDTLDGELDAQYNHTRADTALTEQLQNPLFKATLPAADGDAFSRIKPLYETRAQYLDQSQFFGSEYFLNKIGYDPSKSVTVLGDAYFDNQLIVQSVEQRVGNFFAQTQRLSGAPLVKQLMDNGATLADSAGFTLGEPLTAEQVAGLNSDVVWYENQVVDGQTVLAPRLYLSQKTLAARGEDAHSAALVGGDTVLIDALGVNNINGTIRGNTDTFIYAEGDINNVSQGGTQAGIFAGQGGEGKTAGQLVIAAKGQVRNQGGVMSGYQQTVVGEEGVSSSATTGYDKNGYLVVRDNGVMGTALSADKPHEPASEEPAAEPETPEPFAEAGGKKPEQKPEKKPLEVARPDARAIFEERLASGPVDTEKGSSLSVLSAGTIDLTGAITQADNVLLQTQGTVNLNDLHEVRSAFDSAHSSGFLSQVDIIETAASANSVGNTVNAKNLVIQAQKDLNITGGEINAQTSAIEVGGKSTVAAGKDLAFHEKTVKTLQFVVGGGVGAGGYEATGLWGSAAAIDTHLVSPFDGQGDATQPSPTVRGEAQAGRAAASQALAQNGTGAHAGANKGRGGTSGANVKIGLEAVTTTDTRESATYRNAQLNLGSGTVDVAGTFDFGGADINAGHQLSPEARAQMSAAERAEASAQMPTLDIHAGDYKTTKYESTEKTAHSREELFIGYTAEAHSSLADVATQVSNTAHKAMGKDAVNDPNAPAGSSKTLANGQGTMEIDPALTAVAAAGLATQVAFGEVAGVSATIGVQHSKETSDSQSRSENINQIGGNISLTSTKGDIDLNGVNLQGGKVALKSAGNLNQQAAKSSTSSNESSMTHTVGITGSAGVSPTGVGMGLSVGASGSYDDTHSTSTSYTNGLISGTEVSIETAGDHNLIGSNIKGNNVTAKIGGTQTITSVQDTSDMSHTRSNWSTSVGVAISTAGGVIPTGSASASGGKDFDNSKLVGEQAGISADSLDLRVKGDLNLTGAHITSAQGSVKVDGQINAHTLHDSREKDGGYGGGGGGISKNGIPTATIEAGRVDQVHYQADNAATIDVGNPSNVTAGQGINGPLNTDASKQLDVTKNQRVAGTDVKVEISISDAQEIKAGVKKLFTPKAGGSKTHIAEAPSSRIKQHEPSSKTTTQTEAEPRTFGGQVIAKTDAGNPAKNVPQRLANGDGVSKRFNPPTDLGDGRIG